jgi:hypothetical protein
VDKSQAAGHSGHYILYDGSSVRKLFYITLLAPKIVKVVSRFSENLYTACFWTYHVGKMWEIFMKTCCICNSIVAKATAPEIDTFRRDRHLIK